MEYRLKNQNSPWPKDIYDPVWCQKKYRWWPFWINVSPSPVIRSFGERWLKIVNTKESPRDGE